MATARWSARQSDREKIAQLVEHGNSEWRADTQHPRIFDFNFGTGPIANQAGEFDQFISSRLSDRLSFISETTFGPDTTNEFQLDIERYHHGN